MRATVMMAVLALTCGSCAAQQAGRSAPQDAQPPAANQPAGQAQNVDSILDALDARGRDLSSFTADVQLADVDQELGDDVKRTGKVLYQRKADGSARVRVIFDRRQQNNRIRQERVEYVLDGPTLTDRQYASKKQVTRQVLRPGEKVNLLKLGEGPFPLPIGQKKEDVHRLFDVRLVEPKQGDPANTLHLRLVPKPGSQFERRFKAIDAWVDQQDHFPRRIETVERGNETVRTTDLSNVQVNPQLSDRDFALPSIGEDWTVIEEAYQD